MHKSIFSLVVIILWIIISFCSRPSNPNPTSTIRKDSAVVLTIAGDGTETGNDGEGINSSFGNLYGIASDSIGTLYVADGNFNTIRKINTDGVVSTIAGAGSQPAAWGPGTDFYYPTGVAVVNNTVFVADESNDRVRTVIVSSSNVSTLAGAGDRGYRDGSGITAYFDHPTAMVADKQGNLFVSDRNNNCIRKITPAGLVTTLAGNGSPGHADGTGTSASFFLPIGIAIDQNGNLYVADNGNKKIRKITSGGVVTTFAGGGSGTITDGQGSQASIADPYGIAIDKEGNLYVSQNFFNRIRKITPDGKVTTFAGTGVAGYKDGPVRSAAFNRPAGIAIDKFGNLYVADGENRRIRKIAFY